MEEAPVLVESSSGWPPVFVWRKEGEVSTQSVSNHSQSSTSQLDRSSNPVEEEVESSQESDEALNAASMGKQSLRNPSLFQTSLETGLEDNELEGDVSKKITGENRNLKEKNLNDKIHGNNNMKEKNWVEILFKNQLRDSGFDIEVKEKLEASSEMGQEADKSKREGVEMKLDKRANENATNMGFTNPKSINSGKTKSNEEKKPVQQNSSLPETQIEKEFKKAITEIEEEDWTSSPDEEENYSKAERVFFPELESKKGTAKRYGSLLFSSG
ncbi:hypothetical protein V6N11_069569 [Hibiscus sabdariffa]|uniref:Uncharacterized protein n=1 Tax=Hibiscus sabdariffa TaxID=183260 RepID=A0ABR2Q352_9ROSI